MNFIGDGATEALVPRHPDLPHPSAGEEPRSRYLLLMTLPSLIPAYSRA